MTAVNYPLTRSQRQLWLSTELRPHDPCYNVPFAVRLRGQLDPRALGRALAGIWDRHPALRLSIGFRDGKPIAIDHGGRGAWIDPEPEDARGETEAEHRSRAARFAAEPFDLTRGPLLRTRLVQVSDDTHTLLVSAHHVVFDGESIGIFLQEFAALYAAHATGVPTGLPTSADYGALVREDIALTADSAETAFRYWTRELSGAPEVMDLPVTGTRSPHTRHEAGRSCIRIPPELTSRLRRAAGRRRASLFAILKAAFDVLLYQHGTPDVVTGFAISGRDGTERSAAIGYFAKPVLQRVTFTGTESFADVLTYVRDGILDAYDHPDLALQDIIGALGMARDPGYSPLYQVTFGLNEQAAETEAAGIRFSAEFIPLPTCKAELEMTIMSSEDGLEAELAYRADLFDHQAICAMLTRYRLILERVAGDPKTAVRELVLPSEEEWRFVIEECNRTQADYPRTKLIHELFQDQAERTPNAVAVRSGERRLTYRELDAASDRVAWRLRELGVRLEAPVGVLLPRSERLITAMLGIFKAGGVYVPLDGTLPDQRLRDLADDAGLAVLLTEGERGERILAGSPTRVEATDVGSQAPAPFPGRPADSASAAYILFTSGSTGKPKGVVLEHRNLVNLITWAYAEFGTAMFRVVPLISSVGFDAAMWEMFTALGCGGTAVVTQDAFSLLRTPGAEEATVMTAVPSVLTELLKSSGLPPKIRTVFSGGEQLPASLAERLCQMPTVDTVYNVGGPTETTTMSLFSLVNPGRTVPFGRPVANTTAYVLDQWLRPVPPGVVGQLYFGGDGIARGYLNRPDLTAARFVPDPFSERPGRRLYATGDLARQLPDGRVVFVGRVDHQVKLRGCRIELGEVESALRAHPAVTEACVTVLRRPGGDMLAAAVAMAAESSAAHELTAFLRARLPAFMIPLRIEARAELPLLPSGKMDRSRVTRMLADTIDGAADAPGHAGAAAVASDSAEQSVARLWASLLDREVGLDQNFFDVGGNSLLLLRLREEIRARTGREIALPDLARNPTIRSMATLFAASGTSSARSAPQSRVPARRAAQIARARTSGS